MLGYKLDEFLGTAKDIPFILPERKKEMEERIEERMENMRRGEIVEFESSFKAKDGREIPVLISEALMPAIDGRVITVKDISDMKEREEELTRAVKSFPIFRGRGRSIR